MNHDMQATCKIHSGRQGVVQKAIAHPDAGIPAIKPFVLERRRPGGDWRSWRPIHDANNADLWMRLGYEVRFNQDYWCNS